MLVYWLNLSSMKASFVKVIIVSSTFLIVLCSAIMNQSGPGGGYSNAPGDGNCTVCHTSALITSNNTNLNNIRLKGNFTGNGYIPDSTYSMELTFKQTGKVKYGFQITCLDKTGSPAGTFINTSTRTSKVTKLYNSKTREYIQHTTLGTSTVGTDSTRWVFNWKAPSANIGNLTFYMVVMAANNNGTDDNGDIVYAKTMLLTPSSLLPSALAKSNDTLTCTGYTVQLNGSGTNSPNAYNWIINGGTPSSSTQQNPTVTFSSTGPKTAILTVRNSKGVSFPDTLNFIVNQTPLASILNGSVGNICKGDSINLTASFVSGASYTWLHNGKTSRSVYVKDTGSYKVKVSNVATQCNATSLPFKLSVFPLPTISLSRMSLNDSVCQMVNETITATGTNIDSVLWYVNGKLTYRTKGLSIAINSSSNVSVYAIAKSINNCKSLASNQLNFVVIPKVYPKNIVIQKTTSSIWIKWSNSNTMKSMVYSIDNGSFNACSSDSTLSLSGLNANTNYRIVLRTIQSGPCVLADTVLNIKTNLCSNISYQLSHAARVCLSSPLKITANQLNGKSYSISWNNGPFTLDTIYSVNANFNDSIRFELKDSSSLNCPSIVEYVKYAVDTLLDPAAFTTQNIYSCDSAFSLLLPFAYDSCIYYLNNSMVFKGGNSHVFKGMSSNSSLKVRAHNQTCVKTYDHWQYSPYPRVNAGIQIAKRWKFYDFSSDTNNAIQHYWYFNQQLVETIGAFTYDMTPFIGDTILIKHITYSRNNCQDTANETCIVSDFTSLQNTDLSSVIVFPNPSKDHLFIQGLPLGSIVDLFTMQGQNLIHQAVHCSEYGIDLKPFKSGVYVLMLQNPEGGILQSKIIVE